MFERNVVLPAAEFIFLEEIDDFISSGRPLRQSSESILRDIGGVGITEEVRELIVEVLDIDKGFWLYINDQTGGITSSVCNVCCDVSVVFNVLFDFQISPFFRISFSNVGKSVLDLCIAIGVVSDEEEVHI